MTRTRLAALLLGLPLACRPEPASRTHEQRVIARVGGKEVPHGLFDAYLRDNINLLDETPGLQASGDPFRAEPSPGTGLSDEVRSRLLDRFLQEQALLVEARAAGFQATEEDLDAFARSIGLGPLAELHQGAPLTEREYLHHYLEDCFVVKTYLARAVLAGIEASEEEARAYYEQHPSRFMRPDRYRLRVIRLDTLQDAERTRQEVVKGTASFFDVAQRLSEGGAENEQGKDLGSWRADELPDSVAAAVAGLKAGQVSPVVADPEGAFNLYYVDQVEEGGTSSFEQVRDRVRAKLTRDKKSATLADHLRSLGERVQVELVAENLGFPYQPPSAATPMAPPAASPEPASPTPAGGDP